MPIHTTENKLGFLKTVASDFYAMNKSKLSTLKFLCAMILTPRFTGAFYFRCSSFLYKKGRIGKVFSKFFWLLNYYLNGCEIAQQAIIGAGLNLPHPHGIVIAPAKIGINATILQNVTIGSRDFSLIGITDDRYPDIGDDVVIYAGAVVAGRINIGTNVTIGANCVVTTDVPDDSIAVGIPAKTSKKEILQPRNEQTHLV